jgi:hypothetical protein
VPVASLRTAYVPPQETDIVRERID